MDSGITLKYYLKNSVWSVIVIGVFLYAWINNPDNTLSFLLLLAICINSLLFPFSKYIIQRNALLFSKKEFWQRDFFINPTGGSLVVIFEFFCFILAIPVCLLFLIFKTVKALSKS
ncbi:colicin E1 family microcin immunity protein [Citrobacter sp. Cc139]|uniref:colicin E1 family microcin immunity protein n=1 Tax=Citrobacter TaxID=544 RepID=UPI0008479A0D|nr:colicin transporter [Citrobacter werkmanii]MBQ4937042.1 colicin transporter [Citrobacter werkmanii]MBQ4949907.1 colicin transporter [Citrobacter werkmanii]MBQ4965208.1 colicin transporter [Citrobacter werkmanii]MBS6074306.1 colicin transporter [Citrobacter freundii]